MYTKNLDQDMLISRDKWEGCKLIAEVFTDDLSLYGYNINGQKELWVHIIEYRHDLLLQMKEAIKRITRLCCVMKEERQIRTLNYPLFAFCHLYEHNFFNFNHYAYSGLQKYFKLWKSTFGNCENYYEKYKKMMEAVNFIIDNRDENLLNEYTYLINISLPISGYESLRMDLITILKKIHQLTPIIYNSDNYEQLCSEIKKFKDLYIIEYRKRHLYYQNRLDYLKRKIMTMPLYRILCRLNSIEGGNKADTISYIDSFFANECNKDNIYNILLKQPKCPCGFTIGESLTIPALDKIKPMLTQAVEKRLKYLKEKLKKYYQEKPDSPIKILYTMPHISDIQETDLINIIDNDLINEINNVLGNKNIIKVDALKILQEIEGAYNIENMPQLVNKFTNTIMTEIRNYAGQSCDESVIIKIEHKK